ncbi:hypothetical protein [Sorangium sp. So ce1099]|uniref:hypothetical protein n=1 Tax=Sorangium sp. So ce1099 TaxID=3133331 RepID=UPI003F5F952C
MDTSISLFFGLTMFQAFGAGCTARVQVGDDSGSGGTGGGFSSTSVSSVVGSATVGSGGFSSTSVSSVVGSATVGSGGFSSTSVSSVVGSATVGSGGGDSAPTAGAIALFRSEFPGEPSNDSGSGYSGGPGTDPNDLFIIFGAPVSSCADPSYTSCGSWMLAISISPALQVPGIIDLSWPDPWSYYVVSGPGRDDGSCSFDAGYLTSGTMEIVSIDDEEVVVRLSGAVVRMSGTDTDAPDANGEYTAALCP